MINNLLPDRTRLPTQKVRQSVKEWFKGDTYRSAIIPRSSILPLPTIQPYTLHPPLSQFHFINARHAFAFKVNQMCHIPSPDLPFHILAMTKRDTTTLLPSPSDRGNELRSRETPGLAVEAAVQDQYFETRTVGTSDCRADTLQYERWDDGGVKAADAVDQGFGGIDGLEDLGVRRRPHFLAVRIDVPEPLDARGERLLGRFGEVYVGVTKRRQGAGEIRVFVRDVVEICQGVGMVDVESRRLAGVTDGVLAGYDAAVREAGGDVVREIADDGRQYGGFGFVDAAHDCEEVDGGFKGAGEESGAGEEEVSY